MRGALDLTEPKHLLGKLEHELQAFSADRGNSYAAVNALRDAYHLREWNMARSLRARRHATACDNWHRCQ